ncbi:MAG: putative lipoprotein [Desulfocapsaceae bacterium]|jgi:hypothetical protein|nr:putative lipoprotein [Desulfocapsaceae bacterium]
MKTGMVIKRILLSGCILLAGSGCSISYSVDQSSDSISQSLDSISASFDSFTSISTSSGSEKKDVEAALQRFSDDVKGLTRIFLGNAQGPDDFERQLANIARNYGILDWEHEPLAFAAIGSSLRECGVAEKEITNVAFLQSAALKQNHDRIVEGFEKV